MKKERAEEDAPVQMLVSVSKRHFKHAVDRNRVKRQVREAYRRHKHLLFDVVPNNRQLLVAFIWLADDHRRSAAIEGRVVNLLQRISEREAE
jgi:ribonuclease P protein component